MKNLILIVSLVFLTACGKEVGKNGNDGPPVSNPADWGDPAGEISLYGDKNWVFSGSNVLGQVNCTSPQEKSTKVVVDFNGRLLVEEFILKNNQSTQYDFKLVNYTSGKFCDFSHSGTFLGQEVFTSVNKQCAMSVSQGDVLEIRYIGSCNSLEVFGYYWED